MFCSSQQSLIRFLLGLGLLSLSSTATSSSLAQTPGQADHLSHSSPPVSRGAQPNQQLTHQRKRKRFVLPKLKLNRGIPTAGRSHNASRGCQSQQGGPRLTLLVPEYVDRSTDSQGKGVESRYAMALSATPQPVFWAYVAIDEQAEDISLEFVLQDGEGKKLYSEMLPIPEQSGLVRITSEVMPSLEPGKDYNWFLKQKSRCQGLLSLVRESVEAWVRYEPSAVNGSGGETGYWYDALEAAAGDAGAFAVLVEAIGLENLL